MGLGEPYVIGVEDNDEDVFTIGKWEVGFCGCCTHCVPNCLMSTFCPCVTIAQISARLGIMEFPIALLLYLVIIVCTGGGGAIVVAVWLWLARQQTRERFQIPGGCCCDCLASFCCGCCTMAQIATHIKSYKPGSCDFEPQATLPPYQRV